MQITDLYQTKITCSTYNANIDSTNTVITVKLVDFNNVAVKNKPVTLTCDKGYFNKNGSTTISGTTTKSITANTNDSGEISATWTASEWGLATFSANNNQSQISCINPYPVGSIYISVNSKSPSTIFGGEWVQLTETFLYASTTSDSNSTTATAGETTHTLTLNEIPSHYHEMARRKVQAGTNGYASGTSSDSSDNYYTRSNGGGQAHNNMPPYMRVYMWKRIN